MPNENFDHAFSSWISAMPAVCGAILGWVGHSMVKDDPAMNTKRFVGGVMLSAFTGGCACILLQSMGFPPPLAAVLASAIGSTGVKGYEWLIIKAKDTASQKNTNDKN